MSHRGVGVPRRYAARAGIVALPDGRHALVGSTGAVSIAGVLIGAVWRFAPANVKPRWRGRSQCTFEKVELPTRRAVVLELARMWGSGV